MPPTLFEAHGSRYEHPDARWQETAWDVRVDEAPGQALRVAVLAGTGVECDYVYLHLGQARALAAALLQAVSVAHGRGKRS